jgi:hypothetical protein
MNGLTLNESFLVSAAQWGYRQLFENIWKDILHLYTLILHPQWLTAQVGDIEVFKWIWSIGMKLHIHSGEEVFS